VISQSRKLFDKLFSIIWQEGNILLFKNMLTPTGTTSAKPVVDTANVKLDKTDSTELVETDDVKQTTTDEAQTDETGDAQVEKNRTDKLADGIDKRKYEQGRNRFVDTQNVPYFPLIIHAILIIYV
jgi:hypothetical protein